MSQRQQQQNFTNSITQLSEAAFQKIWDNPEDDDYDYIIISKLEKGKNGR
ncbi:hypothetical protein [Okeania sp. SIO2C2]|nr:hypothetical protein [Okeania sp. SIO2C2]